MANREIRYKLVADASGFKKGVNDARSELEKFGKALTSGLGIGAGFAVGEKAAQSLIGTFKALGDAVKDAVEYGSKINDMAAKTGIAAESLQRLEAAGKTAGVALDAISGGVTKMQRAIVEGSTAFKRLGMDLDELKNLSPDEQFLKVGQAISEIADPAQRAAASIEIFGKAGAGLIPIFDDMASAMERAQERIVLTDSMVSGLDAVADASDALKRDWDDLWTNIGATIATSPGTVSAIEDISAAIRDMTVWVQRNADAVRVWARTIAGALGSFSGLTGIVTGLRGMMGDSGSGGMGFAGGGSSGSWAPPRTFVGNSPYAQAEREAEKARKEMEKTRKELEDFLDRWGSLGALDAKIAPLPRLKLNESLLVQEGLGEIAQGQSNYDRIRAAIIEDTIRKGEAVEQLGYVIGQAGALMDQLGIKADSLFGKLISGFSIAAQAAGSFVKALATGNVFGMISSGLGLLGGIFGLFGGGGPSKEEVARQQRLEAEEKARQEATRIAGLARQSRASGISGLLESAPGFFASRTILTEDDARRQGLQFAAAWGAVVQEKGIAAAAAAFSTEFQKMREEMAAAGIDEPEWVKAIASQMELGMDEKFKALSESAQSAAEFLKALAESGVLTRELLGTFEDEARNIFGGARDRALELGQTPEEAIQAGFSAANPLLKELLNQSILSRQTLSEDIQNMIDEAGIVPDVEFQQLDELRAIRQAVERLSGTSTTPWDNGNGDGTGTGTGQGSGNNSGTGGNGKPDTDPTGQNSGYSGVYGNVTVPVQLNVDGRVLAQATGRALLRGLAPSLKTAIQRIPMRRPTRP